MSHEGDNPRGPLDMPTIQIVPLGYSSGRDDDEALGGLVSKNSRVTSQRSNLPYPQKKKRRLVKEFQLPKFPSMGVFLSSRTKSTPDTVREDKGSLSADVSAVLLHALIPHESRIAYPLNQESTPTSIEELLHNHVLSHLLISLILGSWGLFVIWLNLVYS